MVLTGAQLKAMLPYAKDTNLVRFLAPINDTLAKYQINTPKRVAAFLAQLAHESGSLRYMEEIASGEAYEGRADLGNTEKGDGKRFKGRGPIQITGRANYLAFSKYLGVDFISTPTLLSQPKYGMLAAGWFWNTRNLNVPADVGDFLKITKKINGGTNGLKDRLEHYERIKNVLNID